MSVEDMEIVERLANALARELAGYPSDIQGAVLADCLAMWLAGHHVPGDENATRSLRAEILAHHCSAVRQLVPLAAKIIGTTP